MRSDKGIQDEGEQCKGNWMNAGKERDKDKE
jgi:hypothetical protein